MHIKFKAIQLCSLLLLASFAGNTQVLKGKVFIGGTITAEFTDNKSSYTQESVNQLKEQGNSFSILPAVGFGLGRNWVIGGGVGYFSSQLKQKAYYQNGDGYTNDKTDAGILNLFGRKFFAFNEKAGLYIEAGGNYLLGNKNYASQFENSPPESFKKKYTAINLYLRPGIYYKLSKKTALDAKFGGIEYTHQRSWLNVFQAVHEDDINFTLPDKLSIGFQLLF